MSGYEVTTLLDELADAGIRLRRHNGDTLRVKPKPSVTPSLAARVKAAKGILIELACHVCGSIPLVAYGEDGHPLCAVHAEERLCTACVERSAFLGHQVCTPCVARLIEQQAVEDGAA